MMVKSFKVVKGVRWFHIEIEALNGEKYNIPSFVSEKSALEYVVAEGIRIKPVEKL